MLVLSDLVLICVISIGTALFGVLVLSLGRQQVTAQSAQLDEPLSLLFDEGVLHHATQSALTQFALFPGQSLLEDLRVILKEQFPDFPDQANTNHEGSMTLCGERDHAGASLEMRWRGRFCWVTLHEAARDQDIVLDPSCWVN